MELQKCSKIRLTIVNKKTQSLEEKDLELSLIEYYKLKELKMINEDTFKIDPIYFKNFPHIFSEDKISYLKLYNIHFASIIIIISEEELQNKLLNYVLNHYNLLAQIPLTPEEFLPFSKSYFYNYYSGNAKYNIYDYRKELHLECERKAEMDLWRKEDEVVQQPYDFKLFNDKCMNYFKIHRSKKNKNKTEFCIYFIHPTKKCKTKYNTPCKFTHAYPECLLKK